MVVCGVGVQFGLAGVTGLTVWQSGSGLGHWISTLGQNGVCGGQKWRCGLGGHTTMLGHTTGCRVRQGANTLWHRTV